MYMKIIISEEQLKKIIKDAKPKDGERFIKCDSCRKWFTQTFHKGKKSLAICPWCGRHNTHLDENQEVDERSRSFAFTRKKRLFSKAELMANPNRYKKYDKDLKEIDLYKNDEPLIRGRGPSRVVYDEAVDNGSFLKKVGDFTYLYNIGDEDGSPVVKIDVIDKKKEVYVGYGEFELRYNDDYFVTLPFIRSEFRNRGIATEIYKSMLDFGNIYSGKAQSQHAAGLWYKLYQELPNKMVFVDDKGKEFDIISTSKGLVAKGYNKGVYNIKGGYLKLYKN